MSTSTSTLAIGVDIGGTNMSAAVIDGLTATIVARDTIETLSSQGGDDGMRRLLGLIERVIHQADVALDTIAGVGIGCTGPLDLENGLVKNPYTLSGWDDLPIVSTLSGALQRPVLLLNDAHAAALGEHQAGAGRGTQNMVYITVSTGIGSGLILNGRLFRGYGDLAGEVGHTSIKYDGHPCYCGRHGCWEMYASGPAIATLAKAAVTPESVLWRLCGGQPAAITARHVGDAAQQSDPLAIAIFREAGLYLGVGIANLINTIAPELFVLGGGVMQSHEYLMPAIHETVRQQQYAEAAGTIRIVRAQLGLNAGVIGAACGLLRSLDNTL